jgi:hypothetical protein
VEKVWSGKLEEHGGRLIIEVQGEGLAESTGDCEIVAGV